GTYVYLETVGGGHGARAVADGMDGAHVHITNSLNMPVEAVEAAYPLRVERYELIPDSGGDGEFRGGLGIAREVRALAGETTFSARADSFVTAPNGADGGLPGSHCRVIHNPGTADETVLDPKLPLLNLSPGDVVRLETPGGAGYGSPEARAPTRREADRLDGKTGRRESGAG
ncbi:MAG: hydantoinase B/oxoprolinase family protein, partial [Pseudomonadota bacterium]